MAKLKNPDHLSEVEIKVLIATCNGMSNTEIARTIARSPHSVNRYRKELYKKFYVKNKEEFVDIAGRLFRLR